MRSINFLRANIVLVSALIANIFPVSAQLPQENLLSAFGIDQLPGYNAAWEYAGSYYVIYHEEGTQTIGNGNFHPKSYFLKKINTQTLTVDGVVYIAGDTAVVSTSITDLNIRASFRGKSIDLIMMRIYPLQASPNFSSAPSSVIFMQADTNLLLVIPEQEIIPASSDSISVPITLVPHPNGSLLNIEHQDFGAAGSAAYHTYRFFRQPG